MTRTLTAKAGALVGIARKGRCSHIGCENRSRLALILEMADVAEDGGPGLGIFRTCSEHIESDVLLLQKALDEKLRCEP